MAHDVYISYASEDKAVADAVCAALESNNIRCWIAPRDIPPGAKRAEAVANAIDESRVLVLILSSSSNNSPQVIREVTGATSKGIPIIPIRIDNVVPSKAMDFFVAPSYRLDASEPPLEKHLQTLADMVQTLLVVNKGAALATTITTKGIGVELPDGQFRVVIPKGTPCPFESHILFYTAQPNMQQLRIGVYEGDSSIAEENEWQGELRLELPPGLPEGAPVDIYTSLDIDGSIGVSAGLKEPPGTLVSARMQKLASAPHQQPDFWVAYFRYLAEEMRSYMRDRAEAKRLIAQGNRAIDANDINGLQAVVRQLTSLLPETAAPKEMSRGRSVKQIEDAELINAIAEARNEIVELVNSSQQELTKGDISAIERLDQAYESMSELRQRISTMREKVKSSEGKTALNKLSKAVEQDLKQLESMKEQVKKAEIINRHVQTFNQIMESFETKQKSGMTQTELAEVYSRLESLKESVKSDRHKLGKGEATQQLNELVQQIQKFEMFIKYERGVVGFHGPSMDLQSPPKMALMRKSTLGRQGGSPEVPGGRVDLVHFSVTSPSIVQPDYSFRVGIWAHLEKQRREVIRRAMEAAKEEKISITTQGPMKVEHGTVLTVRLKLEEFIVEPSEATILWEGEIGNTTFGVRVPKDAKKGRRVGIATIHQDGFQVAIIFFELDVGRKSTAVGQIKARVKHHRTAFASYASPDRGEVMKRIQGMQKASPELDIFVDVDALRSGQYWEREIRKIIPSRDVFYLFWSASASKSYWVDQEWRYALEKRGLHFIDPCPLVSPKEVPPPKELESLHFNDRWIFYEESTVAK